MRRLTAAGFFRAAHRSRVHHPPSFRSRTWLFGSDFYVMGVRSRQAAQRLRAAGTQENDRSPDRSVRRGHRCPD